MFLGTAIPPKTSSAKNQDSSIDGASAPSDKPPTTANAMFVLSHLLGLFRRVKREAALLHNPLGLLRSPREAKFFDEGKDVAGELLLELRYVTHEHEERLGLPNLRPQKTPKNRRRFKYGRGKRAGKAGPGKVRELLGCCSFRPEGLSFRKARKGGRLRTYCCSWIKTTDGKDVQNYFAPFGADRTFLAHTQQSWRSLRATTRLLHASP